MRKAVAVMLGASLAICCERPDPIAGPATGGARASDSNNGGAGPSASGGNVAIEPAGGTRYHPPTGFEDCIHAEVKSDCEDGWCKLPPSCFVMGTPVDSARHPPITEDQTAVTLTHHIEMQETEMTRAQFRAIAGFDTEPAPGCEADDCPAVNLGWWDKVHTANLLSEQKGLEPCYRPVGCTGAFGKGLVCEGFEDQELSVYSCEGYRLSTRTEYEYATKAGTISNFWTGDILIRYDENCYFDPHLDPIAWYCHNSGDQVHPVKGKAPNPFGLYDLIGNVQESQNDADRNRSSSGGEDPDGELGTRDRRVYLGCTAKSSNFICRPTNLFGSEWVASAGNTGFRLVRTLDP